MPDSVPPILLNRVTLGLGLLLLASAGHAAPTWTLTWSDDFNGGNGVAADPTRWTYDVGGGGWGNGELETYTNTTANSYQDGSGHLVVQALNSGGYTSARLKTQTLFDQAYGRVEASIQLPAGTAQGSGLWPAFWMLGSNINNVGWPVCGEIDIMENIGQYNTATQNGGHIHGPVAPANGDYYGGSGVGSTFTFPAGQAANTAFHLYAAEWNPSSITFYVDGTAYQTLTAASLPAGGQWVFNHPFFIILNLAIGGGVGGPVGASFPQQMLVDYVRVYKLTNNGTTPYGGTAAAVPGTIQSENYDSYNDAADPSEPGEGFAYNALNATQTNGVFRTGEALSTEACGDTGGTDDCDYTSPGQWMQYSINVTQAGGYNLDARVASSGQGGSFHFDVDGAPVTGEMTCPNTGGWQTYQDVVATGVSLSAGAHQLLLVEDSMGPGGLGVCNFNYVTLSLPSPTATATPQPSNTPVPPTATPLPSSTPVAPTPTPGGGVLAPLQSGMQMTCQFVNNTAGAYGNSQVYVVAIARNAAGVFCHLDNAGNMIPCVSGENGSAYAMTLASFSALQFPATMSSGRLYVSLGTALNIPINTAGDGSVGVAFPDINNPSDPNINTTFDWIELAVLTNAIWCNTTQVDMFGIPMELQLYTGSATSYSLYGASGITECSGNVFSEYAASVPAAFAGLAQAHRIAAPIHGSFGVGGANAGYFDAYINSVWTQYTGSNLVISMNGIAYTGRVGSDGRLAFTDPGDPTTYYVSEPATNDVWGGSGALATGNSTELALEAQICAAFHRHVIDNAANLNNPAAYYQAAPADYYSQFWHQHSLGALAYGFCYDDVNNQSSTLSSANPRGLIITVGGGACGSPTPSPNPSHTASPSRTPTVIPTRTATPTASPSPTASNSPLPSASPSWTASPSATRTSSPTSTPVSTSSPSRTASPQASPSATGTKTPALATASPTPSGTGTPGPVSTTPSPAASQAATKTGTPADSPVPTATATWTASPIPSKTATPTWTASPAATGTPTQTRSPVPTATASWTSSPAPSPSASPSGTPPPSATRTATAAPSATAAPTQTLAPTGSPLPTATVLATRTPAPSATASPVAGSSASPSPAGQGRPGEVVQAAVGPNPSNGDHVTLYVDLNGEAKTIQVAVFSTADVLVLETALQGQFQPGWNKMTLPPLDLANGIYFVRVRVGLSYRFAKLMILR